MTIQITDELTDRAVRSVPMEDTISVEGANDGGHVMGGHVIVRCDTCRWYSDKVAPSTGRYESKPVTGRIARLTSPVPLPELNRAAERHTCPPEVTAAASEARAARGGATVTRPSSGT